MFLNLRGKPYNMHPFQEYFNLCSSKDPTAVFPRTFSVLLTSPVSYPLLRTLPCIKSLRGRVPIVGTTMGFVRS